MTKKKRPEDLLPRGRPRKIRKSKVPHRERAQSPFLLTEMQRKDLPETSPLHMVFDAPPLVSDKFHGALDLTDFPINLPSVRTELTAEHVKNANNNLIEVRKVGTIAYAHNSRKSMRTDWSHWLAYCIVEDRVVMPVNLADLKDFLDALIAAGYKRASLEHLLFTLKIACEVWGCPCPIESLVFRSYWKRVSREELVKSQYQAPPLNVEDLEALAASTPDDDPRALRDLAFAAVAYDAMARASELVAMRWETITFEADAEGGANVKLLRSKSDVTGDGVDLYLTPETANRLRAWQQHAVPGNPFVFHALPRHASQVGSKTKALSIREVSRTFERIARRSGTRSICLVTQPGSEVHRT